MMPTVETQSELVFSRQLTAGGAEPKNGDKTSRIRKENATIVPKSCILVGEFI